MKRSPLGRKTPLARSPLKRSAPKARTPLLRPRERPVAASKGTGGPNPRTSGPVRRGGLVTCRACGVEFYVPPAGIASRKFCSQACMGRAATKTRACTVCAVEFTSKGSKKKMCSEECRNEAIRRAKLGDGNPMKRAEVSLKMVATREAQRAAFDADLPLPPAQEWCARPGCPNKLTGQAAIYCSCGCHYNDRGRRGSRREQAYHCCATCEQVFAWNGRGKGVYCSDGCSHRGGAARGVDVVEVVKLRGFRRADFRDGDECRVCGGRAVHQHHVVFRSHVERAGGDRWHPDDALGLCVADHANAHGARRISLACLRDENFAFARELLGAASYDYLRRRYTGDDPRLDALLHDAYQDPRLDALRESSTPDVPAEPEGAPPL